MVPKEYRKIFFYFLGIYMFFFFGMRLEVEKNFYDYKNVNVNRINLLKAIFQQKKF